VGLGVEDGRVLVRVGERLGEVLAGHPVHLAQDRPGGVHVDVGERALTEDLVALEHLEEVELDVADVALVVAHGPTFSQRWGSRCGFATGQCYQSVTTSICSRTGQRKRFGQVCDVSQRSVAPGGSTRWASQLRVDQVSKST
jgi:hypothetical protein